MRERKRERQRETDRETERQREKRRERDRAKWKDPVGKDEFREIGHPFLFHSDFRTRLSLLF